MEPSSGSTTRSVQTNDMEAYLFSLILKTLASEAQKDAFAHREELLALLHRRRANYECVCFRKDAKRIDYQRKRR